MRMTNCNDICVTGGMHSNLDGTYVWIDYNRNRNTSIYYCKDCATNGTYLYGWIFDTGAHRKIGSDHNTANALDVHLI